jgi:hypothetical protein
MENYDRMVDTDHFVQMDGTLPVNVLQRQTRELVESRIPLERFRSKP